MIEYMVAPRGIERLSLEQLAALARVDNPEKLAKRMREKKNRATLQRARTMLARSSS